MEGRFGFHGKPPTPEQAEQALAELEEMLAEQTQGLELPTVSRAPRPASRPARPTATRSSSWGSTHPEVVALDADLAVSTQSAGFGKRFPERFFNVVPPRRT